MIRKLALATATGALAFGLSAAPALAAAPPCPATPASVPAWPR